jgi:hypothetical protein
LWYLHEAPAVVLLSILGTGGQRQEVTLVRVCGQESGCLGDRRDDRVPNQGEWVRWELNHLDIFPRVDVAGEPKNSIFPRNCVIIIDAKNQ